MRNDYPKLRVTEKVTPTGLETEYKHPSYAMVTATRISGSRTLFGSAVEDHPTAMRFRVREGYRVHANSRDRFLDTGDVLIEFEMSTAQYVELITNPNSGCGVPCTLLTLDTQRMPPIPSATVPLETVKIQDDFQSKCREVGSKLNELEDSLKKLQDKKTVSKTDLAEFARSLQRVKTEIGLNLPFVLSSFQEASDKILHAVKVEVDAVVQQQLSLAGIKALYDHAVASGEITPVLEAVATQTNLLEK